MHLRDKWGRYGSTRNEGDEISIRMTINSVAIDTTKVKQKSNKNVIP